MDIKTKVTYYPLKKEDGKFHIMKKTEIISPVIEIIDFGFQTDDYISANEACSAFNDNYERMKDAYLSDTQDTP